MPAADFTLESAESDLRLGTRVDPRPPTPGPGPDGIHGRSIKSIAVGHGPDSLNNETSRSRIPIVPITLAPSGVTGDVVVASARRLDASKDLIGGCDFFFTGTTPATRLKAPITTFVEATRDDIAFGPGGCTARMVGASMVDSKGGEPDRPIDGCVTTGENRHVFRLVGEHVTLGRRRLSIPVMGPILAEIRAPLLKIILAANPGRPS